jgi:hypothetical protein
VHRGDRRRWGGPVTFCYVSWQRDRDPTEGALLVNGYPIQAYQRADVVGADPPCDPSERPIRRLLARELTDFERSDTHASRWNLPRRLGLDRGFVAHTGRDAFRVGPGHLVATGC